MSRTDAILCAISALLERKRLVTDDPTLVNLTLLVRLDERTGRLRKVLYRPEFEEVLPMR